jgi:hypothetical protein
MSTFAIVATCVVVLGVLGCAGVAVFGFLGGTAREAREVRDSREARLGRAGALVALGVTGLLLGLMGSLIQPYTLRLGGSASGELMDATSNAAPAGPGGVAFPLGALCSLLALAVLFYVGARVFRGPIGVCVPALGWIVAVGALTFGTSKGDVILASTVAAEIFVYGGLVVAMVVLVFAYQWQLADRLESRTR